RTAILDLGYPSLIAEVEKVVQHGASDQQSNINMNPQKIWFLLVVEDCS
ncbi:hypothetical protein A2U01_0108064, partial [Trifolium medium]|nr:hypothetical protein [Trifolium medium]